ncbi:MAG: Smr/MutS family protein [Afipia sp.]|nr:Smr/MutS family protein [Afipia sp.]
MKKPKNLDPPRRKRALSGEELELWQSVAKEAKPLRKKKRVADETAAPTVAHLSPLSTQSKKSAKLFVPPKPATLKPAAPPPLAPLGRRERSQLSRGRKEIDARLDLHGMTQARAHRALLNFLHEASDEGCTFVLVITGKGRTAEPGAERGLLKRMVPEWLGLPEFRSVVVGFETAHIGHGGEGALYVRVRRAR